MSIDDNKLDQLKRAVENLESLLEEAEDFDDNSLKREIKSMETSIHDFMDAISQLSDEVDEARERAEDDQEEEEESASEEDEEED